MNDIMKKSQSGLKINSPETLSNQILKYVAEEDEESLINFLSVTHPNLEHKFSKGRTLLHLFVTFALTNKKLNCLNHVVNSGANIEAEDENGITPVLLACRHKNLEYVKVEYFFFRFIL